MIYLVKINEQEHMVKPPLDYGTATETQKVAWLVDNADRVLFGAAKSNNSSNDHSASLANVDSTDDKLKCVQEVVRDKPLFVGFSMFTAGGIRNTAEVCKEIKKVSNIPIVWGNAHPTLVPEQCLKELYIDLIVLGEGEETVVELARALEKGRTPSEVKGIGYTENGKLKFTEPRPFIQNLDRYRIDWSFVDVERYVTPYWNLKRVISLVTSRGCPFNCCFCYNQVFHQRKWRAHSVDFVVSEVEKLKHDHGIQPLRLLTLK